MKVQVSKTFAKWMNTCGGQFTAEVVTMKPAQYGWQVGDQFDAMDSGDYDWERQLFKVIMVAYPDDYYACPLYLTTARLNSEFRRRGVSNEAELKSMILDMCEI